MRSRFNRLQRGSVSFFAFQDVITGVTGFLVIIAVFLALDVRKIVDVTPEPAAPKDLTATLEKKVAEIVTLKEQVTSTAVPVEDEQTLRRMIEDLKRSIERLSPTNQSGPVLAEESALSRELRIGMQLLLTRLEELKKSLPAANSAAKEADAHVAELEQEVLKLQNMLQQAYDEANILRLIPDGHNTSKEPILVVVTKQSFQVHVLGEKDSAKAATLEELTRLLKPHKATVCYVVLYFKPSGAQHFQSATDHVRELGYEIGYDVLPEALEVNLGPRS